MKTNSDTTHYLAPGAPRSRFVLSRRKNERGQVAIFVALIFQVVFVFFALLINVGLLVHHKINLQHSTDLAAYYGAMKQAESMNAIAHINFQMRQAWKLLTWRYRVLGTFGFIQGGVGVSQQFPFNQNAPSGSGFTFNGSLGQAPTNLSNAYLNGTAATNCTALGDNRLQLTGGGFMGIQDIPFFCVGHEGIYNWTQGESLCRLSCGMFLGANVINAIPAVSTASTLTNPNLSGTINTTINTANNTIQTACQNLGPVGAKLLTKFLVAYQAEETFRSETIKMLAANLSEDVGRTVDLDGNLIIDGSRRTFQNNLTGANFTGLDQSASFRAYNGLNNQRCKFVNGKTGGSYEFLKKIEFKLVNYFLHTCTTGGGSTPTSFNY
ncbi:MAG: Tad domain-containing protein, partial [Bdellovibrionaceae bacterium]|nr:Tad domain-containing protein [Pseudobdellovibrionaceae bacterium]